MSNTREASNWTVTGDLVSETKDLKLQWIWQWVGGEEYFNAGYF